MPKDRVDLLRRFGFSPDRAGRPRLFKVFAGFRHNSPEEGRCQRGIGGRTASLRRGRAPSKPPRRKHTGRDGSSDAGSSSLAQTLWEGRNQPILFAELAQSLERRNRLRKFAIAVVGSSHSAIMIRSRSGCGARIAPLRRDSPTAPDRQGSWIAQAPTIPAHATTRQQCQLVFYLNPFRCPTDPRPCTRTAGGQPARWTSPEPVSCLCIGWRRKVLLRRTPRPKQ